MSAAVTTVLVVGAASGSVSSPAPAFWQAAVMLGMLPLWAYVSRLPHTPAGDRREKAAFIAYAVAAVLLMPVSCAMFARTEPSASAVAKAAPYSWQRTASAPSLPREYRSFNGYAVSGAQQ